MAKKPAAKPKKPRQAPTYRSKKVIEQICARLAEGESLASICRDGAMPSWKAIHNWINDDPEIDAQITRAREIGYMLRADRAIEEAKRAEDAALGRLAFDAERWYLGKLSNAFADRKRIDFEGNLRIEAVKVDIVE